MKHIFFLTLITFFSVFSCYSQTNPIDLNRPTVVTPEVATMMKYIDYPVDFCYGIANIQIPIYEFEFDGVKIPISISYHSSGLKVKDTNGRLGIGWSLDVSPSISRQINGMPDESGYLMTSGEQRLPYPMDFYYEEQLADGRSKDEAPDAFYYQLLNKSGKFYLNRGDLSRPSSEVGITLVPFEPIRVNPISVSSLSGFDITDENGFRYSFNGENRAYSDSRTIQWKVKTITSPNRKTLSYTYSPLAYTNVTWNLVDYYAVEEQMQSLYALSPWAYIGCSSSIQWPFMMSSVNGYDAKINNIYVTQNNKPDGTLAYTGTPGQSIPGCYNINPPVESGGAQLSENLLTSLETDKIRIELTGGYELTGLKIIDKSDNSVIRTVKFELSDCNTSIPPERYRKRKLDKMEILDRNGNLAERYRFDYYYPERVPGILDKNIDHWGYFNGTALGAYDTSVPYQTITAKHYISYYYPADFTMTIGLANKEPSLDHARTGMLRTITYPTGRQSNFEYELNSYVDTYAPGNPVMPAGGLRISRIEDDGLNRTFKYGENQNGGGELKNRITPDSYKYSKVVLSKYKGQSTFSHSTDSTAVISSESDTDQSASTATTAVPTAVSEAGYAPSLLTYYASEPFPNLFYNGGSPVFYQYVTEYRNHYPDYMGPAPNGKTIYKYSHPNSYSAQYPGTTLIQEVGEPWMGSKLVYREDYKSEANGQFSRVRKESYDYIPLKESSLAWGKAYRRILFRDSFSDEIKSNAVQNYQGFIHVRSQLKTGGYKLIKETVETFVNGMTTLVQEKTYNYNNLEHLFVTELKEKNSNGVESVTKLKYPQDLSFASGSPEESARGRLVTNNQLNIPMQQTFQAGTDASTTRINKISYTIDPSTGNPLPKNLNKGRSNNEEERVVITDYNPSGKPVSITTDNAMNTVYVWGYKGEFLIAEIKNASYLEVCKKMGNGSEQTGKNVLNNILDKNVPSSSDFSQLNALREQLPEAMVTTYTCKPLVGIQTMTDPAGKKLYYEYDPSDRLKSIKDHNGNVVESYDYRYRNN